MMEYRDCGTCNHKASSSSEPPCHACLTAMTPSFTMWEPADIPCDGQSEPAGSGYAHSQELTKFRAEISRQIGDWNDRAEDWGEGDSRRLCHEMLGRELMELVNASMRRLP